MEEGGGYVECELCNEDYDDLDEERLPRLLTCGHTYCQVCVLNGLKL